MSKITKALEKAARERRRHQDLQATVDSKGAVASIVAADDGTVADVGSIKIDPHIICAADQQSAIAEQYRMLRTNIQSLQGGRMPKVLAVTSAVHEEGKSVTSINLAMAFAQQDKFRVVLVDADMRKGSMERWLGLQRGAPGLSTILKNDGRINGSLLRLQSPSLTICPPGPLSDNPADLLSSPALKRLLDDLRARFDLVVIDAPPVLPVADPSILASQVDGVLFVVRAGATSQRIVKKARSLLEQVKAPVLGCILTHVEYYNPLYNKYYRYYQEESRQQRESASSTSEKN